MRPLYPETYTLTLISELGAHTSMASHFLGSEQLQLLDSLSPPMHWPG